MLQVCAVDFTAFHFLRGLLHGAREDGWEVAFACADGPWARVMRDEGFRYWPIPITRSPSPLAHTRAIATLALRLSREPQDVIHTHTPVGGMVGRAAAVLGGGSVPVAHTFHGLPFASAALSPMERAFLLLERALARRTTWWFSQASGDVARAVALGIATPARITAIGNGVDLERFRPVAEDRSRVRAELGIPHDGKVVITIGRLVREKGILDVADAALRIRSDGALHILVVGAALASDRTSVVAQLDAHPVARSTVVRWLRLGHRGDVDSLLRAADVFVLASRREGLPRSVIEALATGVPVVASDIPACRELVDDEVGRLVSVGDVAALARALEEILRDDAGRARMSVAARGRALERHDERSIVAHQLRILRWLAE